MNNSYIGQPTDHLRWRGAVSSRGALKIQIVHKGKMVNAAVSYAVLYFFFPEIMVPIYILRAMFDYFHTRHLRKLQQMQQQKFGIAVLEANMGILPLTDGEWLCQNSNAILA